MTFFGNVFLKNEKCFLLAKNIGRKISSLKILRTKDHPSLNYGPLNFLFGFADS